MATFGPNYGLETADESIASCPQVALRYFGPFPAKRCLEMIDTSVFFSTNLALQNDLERKVQRICIWRIWWPLYRGNDARNVFFSHSWLTRALCDGAESPVGMSAFCGRNVCLPRVLILPLRHFPNNFGHLF
jgi:hypothetical protein